MSALPHRSMLPSLLVPVLALGLSACAQSQGFSTIDCTFAAERDAEPQSASIPKATGEMSLATGQLEASVSVTLGEDSGSIAVTVRGPSTTDDPTPSDIATTGSRFDRRSDPGGVLLAVEGGSASNGPFSVECSSS